MTSFVITPLPAGEVDTEAPVARRTVSEGRAPCRRCLRDAEHRRALVLAPYDPFTVRSPYAGDGPVFVHADGCEPLRARARPGSPSRSRAGEPSIRAYDGEAMMTGADGAARTRPSPSASRSSSATTGVEFLHVHFAGPGCFAFRVDRA